jgi:hypothetical protein
MKDPCSPSPPDLRSDNGRFWPMVWKLGHQLLLPRMLENTGITSQNKKLLLNGINSPLSFIASISGAMFLDKAGRRPLLMYTLMGCIIYFSILTPVSKLADTHPDNVSAANTSIALSICLQLCTRLLGRHSRQCTWSSVWTQIRAQKASLWLNSL